MNDTMYTQAPRGCDYDIVFRENVSRSVSSVALSSVRSHLLDDDTRSGIDPKGETAILFVVV
jgi:hypothetical protein